MFDEIETKQGTTPVVSADGDFEGGGTLILAGRKSESVLQCNKTLRPRADSDGWFTLNLRAPNGRTILLHNALLTKSIRHGFTGAGNYEEHIYPNVVILGSEVLTDGKIKKISFTLNKLNEFFYYQHIESHFLFNPPSELLKELKKLRHTDHEYDIFEPQELYLAHSFPNSLDFRVGSAKYTVYAGGTQSSLGWHTITHRAIPIASITFDTLVSIDEALDAAWRWKQFFSSLVLKPLSFTSMTASNDHEDEYLEADIYIPTHLDDHQEDTGHINFWPGNIPLNTWQERDELGRVMASWINKQHQRKRLRGAIENVSRHIGQRVSIDDIVTLCAGIESLEELSAPASLTPAEINTLSEGAVTAAIQNGIDIDSSRIRGVLDLLQHQSLPKRLKRMFEKLKPWVSDTQAKLLISSVLELRIVAAHGKSPTASITPKASPTIEGLACACVLYDFATCGMPTKTASDQNIGILSHLLSSISELELIKSLAKPKD